MPIRAPFKRVGVQELRVVAPGGGVQVVVAGSFASGDGLSSAPKRIAASVTVRAIGPAVS
jgi:hypothetical protein